MEMVTKPRRSSTQMFFFKEDIMEILGISSSKAYAIMRELGKELKAKGYSLPPAGRIQKSYFCEKFCLDRQEIERALERKNLAS